MSEPFVAATPQRNDPVPLGADDAPIGHPFAHPSNYDSDFALLNYLVQDLRVVVRQIAASGTKPANHESIEWEVHGLKRRTVLCDVDRLVEPHSRHMVGFFGDRRTNISEEDVDETELDVVGQFRHFPGIISYSSIRGGRLLRAGEPPLELSLPSNVDISQVGLAGGEFAGYSYGNNGEQSLVRIMPDGGVVTTVADDAEFNIRQRSFTPDGSPLVSEAGGVYIGGADGFERISTGFLISASTNHVLVRECDELMACGFATIEFESGERAEAVLADDTFGRFGFDSAQVSPDGRWLRYVTFANDSSDSKRHQGNAEAPCKQRNSYRIGVFYIEQDDIPNTKGKTVGK